jgi:hypothetical protein
MARPRPRPSGVTSTRAGGLELYLVPATMTSTAARWCDLDPARRPRCYDAFHRRLRVWPGEGVEGAGVWRVKGSMALAPPSRAGTDGDGKGSESRPDGAFYC